VPVEEARIGLGFRLRESRLGIGGDAELLRAAVRRASRSGSVVATGVAARLVGGLDAVRLGDCGAIVITLDVGLASIGTFSSPAYEPTISLSAGLRF